MNGIPSEKDTNAVIEILTDALGVEEKQLAPEARLTEDLGADSLTVIEISMALEERFNLTLPDDAVERVQTVGDIFELLAEMLQPPNQRC